MQLCRMSVWYASQTSQRAVGNQGHLNLLMDAHLGGPAPLGCDLQASFAPQLPALCALPEVAL